MTKTGSLVAAFIVLVMAGCAVVGAIASGIVNSLIQHSALLAR